MENYKRQVKFKDAEKNLAVIDVEIKQGRFSMSGEYNGGMGQVDGRIKPKNEAQRDFLNLWDKWHLNDMHAGTEAQEKAIEDYQKNGNKYDYTKACEYLKSINLYEVEYNGKPYEYGNGWLAVSLPQDMTELVDNICNKIERIEAEEKKELPKIDWTDVNDDKIIALAKYLDITPEEAQEDITEERDNRYNYAGNDYLVCTDEEANEEAREQCEQYVDDCMDIPDNVRPYFDMDRYTEDVICSDGRGHLLNRYDGEEGEENINDVWYFIYRQ